MMKKLLAGALFAITAAAGLLSAPEAAHAGQVMCAAPQSAGAQARAIGGTLSSVPSKSLYTLNADGCAAIKQQDVGFFQSQGFFPGTNYFSISAVGIGAQTTTSNSPILPAGAFINGIVIQETAGQIVTGGLDIGTAGSSSQTIVAAIACPANCLIGVPPASILLFTFGATTTTTGVPKAQQIFINAHTNWTDAAIVNVTIFYSLYIPT